MEQKPVNRVAEQLALFAKTNKRRRAPQEEKKEPSLASQLSQKKRELARRLAAPIEELLAFQPRLNPEDSNDAYAFRTELYNLLQGAGSSSDIKSALDSFDFTGISLRTSFNIDNSVQLIRDLLLLDPDELEQKTGIANERFVDFIFILAKTDNPAAQFLFDDQFSYGEFTKLTEFVARDKENRFDDLKTLFKAVTQDNSSDLSSIQIQEIRERWNEFVAVRKDSSDLDFDHTLRLSFESQLSQYKSRVEELYKRAKEFSEESSVDVEEGEGATIMEEETPSLDDKLLELIVRVDAAEEEISSAFLFLRNYMSSNPELVTRDNLNFMMSYFKKDDAFLRNDDYNLQETLNEHGFSVFNRLDLTAYQVGLERLVDQVQEDDAAINQEELYDFLKSNFSHFLNNPEANKPFLTTLVNEMDSLDRAATIEFLVNIAHNEVYSVQGYVPFELITQYFVDVYNRLDAESLEQNPRELQEMMESVFVNELESTLSLGQAKGEIPFNFALFDWLSDDHFARAEELSPLVLRVFDSIDHSYTIGDFQYYLRNTYGVFDNFREESIEFQTVYNLEAKNSLVQDYDLRDSLVSKDIALEELSLAALVHVINNSKQGKLNQLTKEKVDKLEIKLVEHLSQMDNDDPSALGKLPPVVESYLDGLK